MRLFVIFDVSPQLVQVVERLCASPIEQKLEEIMSAIDNLRNAISGVETNVADGFTALQGAVDELASDIANLPANKDVEAEAARLSNVAANISSGIATFSQGIRDAIPTETVPNPAPVEGTSTTGAGEAAPAGEASAPASGTESGGSATEEGS